MLGQTGQYQKALDSHQAFSQEMRQYIRQKEDKIIQELRMMYEVQLKDRQIQLRTMLVFLLGALLIIAVGAIFIIYLLNRKISRQNQKIKSVSRRRSGTLVEPRLV